ncbi:MAG TPA: SCO family protein [Candidatus Baltobacteraceae bacterium]|nr:SCO family protein [Candidatus Baltobacteraceae bacterium]
MLGRIRASAFAILAAIALAQPASAARLPQLIDQNGHPFTFASLRGTPLIVTFIAAHCTDACPLINAQFAQASQQLAKAHVHVRLLTITLDPEHDSLRDMREIARRFGADPHMWILADGSRSDVHAIMNAFGVTAERGRKGYADVHTTFVYLVDARGNLRKTILASTALSDQIVELAR